VNPQHIHSVKELTRPIHVSKQGLLCAPLRLY
jgi:hypothetical protein